MTFPSTATVVACTLVIAACLALAALFFFPVPDANRDPVNLVLGALLGWVGAVITFHFGSSHGSQAKDATIARMAGGAGQEDGR